MILYLTADKSNQDFGENNITMIEQSNEWEDLFCGTDKKVFIFISISTFHILIFLEIF